MADGAETLLRQRIARGERRAEAEKVGRIDRQRAEARAPMKVRARHSARRSNQSDFLPALHRVADGNFRATHVEVAGDETVAVVHVHDVARQKELGDERHDAAVRREDRLTERATIVDAEMAARHSAVEHAPAPEPARDFRLAWA